MENASTTMKYIFRPTYFVSMRNICNLHHLQLFSLLFYLNIILCKLKCKKCNQRSNHRCNIPTLQSLGKKEKKPNKTQTKKNQKAQVQVQDQNPTKSNQETINNIQRRKEQAETTPPGTMLFQSRLQKPKCVNCNNTNMQVRTTRTCK
jgi:hypothetical protein